MAPVAPWVRDLPVLRRLELMRDAGIEEGSQCCASCRYFAPLMVQDPLFTDGYRCRRAAAMEVSSSIKRPSDWCGEWFSTGRTTDHAIDAHPSWEKAAE